MRATGELGLLRRRFGPSSTTVVVVADFKLSGQLELESKSVVLISAASISLHQGCREDSDGPASGLSMS